MAETQMTMEMQVRAIIKTIAASGTLLYKNADTGGREYYETTGLTWTPGTPNVLWVNGNVDINGNDLIIDADADSYLHASADDSLVFVIGGAASVTITANLVLAAGYVDAKTYYYLGGNKLISIDGTNNFLAGVNAGNNYTGQRGVAIGNLALGSTGAGASGDRVICVGYESGTDLTTGYDFTAIGYRAGQNATQAFRIFALGSNALDALTTGTYHVAIGAVALGAITTEDYCSAIGDGAGRYNAADAFTWLGHRAGYNVTGGGYSTGAGFRALGRSVGTGNCAWATALGAYAGYTNAPSYGIYIGAYAGYYETETYKLFIDSIDRGSEANGRTLSLVYGIMAAATANQSLLVNGYMWAREAYCGYERSSDPAQPAEGQYVIWLSDGTGKGDDGDVMIASTAGGVTNYGTLFDHSAGAAW